ncbi:MAG: hypothetical protein ACFFAT_00130 [Promethearchaeota archaeon]
MTITSIITAAIIVRGFNIPESDVLGTFIGSFFICMPLIGIPWLLGILTVNLDISDKECLAVISLILGFAAAVGSFFLFFHVIFKSIGDLIFQQISNAFTAHWSSVLEDVEVPGFEPFLIITVFIVISIVIIYSYHISIQKDQVKY